MFRGLLRRRETARRARGATTRARRRGRDDASDARPDVRRARDGARTRARRVERVGGARGDARAINNRKGATREDARARDARDGTAQEISQSRAKLEARRE